MNTFLAAAAAGLAWAIVERLRDGHFTTLGAASGIVAGLVAITPGAGFVAGMAPLWIGMIAGIVCCFAVGLKTKAGYDDALDVVGVHFVGGLVGSLMLGLFAQPDFFPEEQALVFGFKAGVFHDGGWSLLRRAGPGQRLGDRVVVRRDDDHHAGPEAHDRCAGPGGDRGVRAGPRGARRDGVPQRCGHLLDDFPLQGARRMKLVTAVIKPFKQDDVKEALKGVGVGGLTFTEVQGFGRQAGHTEVYRGAEYTVELVPKVKVEVLIEDAQEEAVTTAIAEAARTGKIGDGKIWVTAVDGVLRIRTGEMGGEAI